MEDLNKHYGQILAQILWELKISNELRIRRLYPGESLDNVRAEVLKSVNGRNARERGHTEAISAAFEKPNLTIGDITGEEGG